MKLLLLPFTGVYWVLTTVRNLMYDWNILSSTSIKTKSIVVGNLSTGGTGKSPMIMYLTDMLLDSGLVAILSRGYKRKSKGFKFASYQTTASDIGDEPQQFFNRYKNKVIVAVCESRVRGAREIEKIFKPNIILLDDAYQHRKFKTDYSILLTDYSNLFYDDFLLPTGNLRESKIFSKRANIIVVTKCPTDLSENKKQEITSNIKLLPHQKLFFSSIKYSDRVLTAKYNINEAQFSDIDILVITGIAKGEDFKNYCTEKFKSVQYLKFEDHYNFTPEDVENIQEKFRNIDSDSKIIVTTEKDYTKLSAFDSFGNNLFYMPIAVDIIDKEQFNSLIFQYVNKN